MYSLLHRCYSAAAIQAVRYRSANMANSAIHPSGVGKWVVIHVIRYMDYGVKT